MSKENEFERKKTAALDVLAQTGIWKSNYLPPITRIFWALGVKIKPPHFVSAWENAVLFGGYFAVAWGSMMWLFLWSKQDAPFSVTFFSALLAGVLFGGGMAASIAYSARKHNLPSWESL